MKTKHIFLTCAFILCLSACQDEEIMPAPADIPLSRAIAATSTSTSVLTTANGGLTWTASRRVPLVGEGRIVDDMSNALIEVLNNNQGIANMLDTDLTNSASFSGVATANLIGNQIASVRDVNRTYAGGQAAGFVYLLDNSSLLTLDVLKGFYLKTYLKGVEQEMKGSDSQVVETLQLNLIGAANNGGQQALSITTSFSKPFDEIKIGMYGISATVLNALKLYYAFVGDNPIQPAVTGNAYYTNGVAVHTNSILELTWTTVPNSGELIDANLSNGPSFSLIGSLLQPRATINFKQVIPIGAEVGFNLSNLGLANISLLGTTTLTTYDANDTQQEQVSISNLLGISAIIGGGTQVSMVLKKPCTQVKIQFSGINVNLGTTTINYAFVRDASIVDPSSFFSLSNATITGNSYQLVTPATGSVNYTVTSYPSGATPVVSNNKITGMTVNGSYQVTGTYTAANGTVYTQTATITRNAVSNGSASCNTMITGISNGATVYAPSGGGCLLCVGEGTNFTGKSNLIDNNPDNYITYYNVASIAANTSIVGIRTAATTPVNTSKAQIRTGFVIQTSSKLLSANVLKYLIIRLYRNGVKIFESTADNNNAISAGLIGDSGNKVRVGVTTNLEFDAIELWTGGILNLNLNAFRIYYAYWENVSDNCYNSSIANACLQLMTPSTYGASINYAATGSPGVAHIGTSLNNLGNLIDADENTYSTITTTNALGAVTVAVKFNRIQQKQPVGFIVADPAGIAGADLINWTTLSVYNAGVLVGQTGTGGVLGLDVIGTNGRQYMETTPSSAPFDEVRITFSGVVNALKTIQLAGVYTRQDSNGDGIPDCAEVTPGQDETIDFLGVTAHLCQGSPIVLQVKGGTNGNNYLLRFYNVVKNNEVTDKTVALTNQTFTITNMPAGDYYISIYDAGGTKLYYNGIHSTVHPLRTTWKTNAGTSNWNTWGNWSDGSPWQCTDVIIPSGAALYPVLVQGDANYCNNLHFAPNAEIVNTHYLTYSQAWAEMALQSGRYYMLSAPLKATFTGDMFIPASMSGTQNNDFFVTLNETTSPENRFSPRIYQRLWSHDAPGQKISGGTLTPVTVTPDKTNWTPPFNALNQAYTVGMGFSLLADKESVSGNTLTFRFPKAHTHYTYYNMSGQGTSYSENLTRTLPGRFIYENSSGTVTFPYTVNATNKAAGTSFLIGNPFMTHIRIDRFMTDNPSVTSIKVYDGNSNNSVIKVDGQLLTNGSNFQYIAPMQSFFVTVSLPATGLSVKFTEAALTQAPGSGGLMRSTRAMSLSGSTSASRPTLLLSATAGNITSGCLIRLSSSARDGFRAGEDSELLMDNEVSPIIAVFSISDEKALDIQQLNNAVQIPLGFSLRNPARVTLKLSHDSGNAWKNWSLVDTQTGKRTSLSASETTLDLGILSTHVGRFYLMKNQ